tara:strand:- start:55418 stop:55720 length:303 start_codon:yes stop_codon:yes gene_type:complete
MLLALPVTLLASDNDAKIKEDIKNYFISENEPSVKDAVWTDDHIFKVGVLDNGSNRDGFADYVCLELNQKGLKDTLVRVVDIAAIQKGKWVNLGTSHCNK